jgi:hypothetical protein
MNDAAATDPAGEPGDPGDSASPPTPAGCEEASRAAVDQQVLEAIRVELENTEIAATHSAQNQFEAAKQWRLVNLSVGTPATVLAAAAGSTALARTSLHVWSGVMALAAAALGGLLTTLNANRRSTQAHTTANAYLAVQSDARIARNVDLPRMDADSARTTLSELKARYDEINNSAEIPNRFVRRRALKNIKRGDQAFTHQDRSRL